MTIHENECENAYVGILAKYRSVFFFLSLLSTTDKLQKAEKVFENGFYLYYSKYQKFEL